MFEHVRETVQALEDDTRVATRAQALRGLRALGLDDFGQVLWSMPNSRFPRLSGLLPAMASEQVQRNWTGNAGIALLRQTSLFVRALSSGFAQHSGRALQDATVLDYGCGYGRIARLLYYFTDEERVYGVDPWSRSIELCNEAGMKTNFLVSDYLPKSLPVGDVKFDLIYAFSVFTHLSRRATTAALNTLRDYVADDGLLCITVRPVEYWAHDPETNDQEKARFAAEHRAKGFAFHPHNREPIDGDITYGDTSFTLAWLAESFPRWSIRATDRTVDDEYQRYVFLAPR